MEMEKQSLKQIDSQIIELAQEQDDLNSVLGLMLCSAECLSNRFGKEKRPSIFEYYNLNNAGNIKNEKNLKDQLKIQTKIFRNNYKYILNQNKAYPFPNNLKKDDITNLIDYWKINSKEENQIYFDNIHKILNGDFNLIYPEKTVSNEGLSPDGIINYFPSAITYVDEKRNEVYNDVVNNGYYNNELKIGYTAKTNDNFQYKNNDANSQNNTMQIENNLIILLDNTFKKAENYYYLLIGKTKDYNCVYGDQREYDKNNVYILERELKEYLSKLKSAFESYLMNFSTTSNEIKKYQLKAILWFNETKNYIFNELFQLFNYNNK